ncbi:MAG: O-antigen ligase family protein, partial [Candidatus Omnitrophica bacterium]|nr:O-antigen ligase family protein [Candidatus Omnitrophota bacterium]
TAIHVTKSRGGILAFWAAAVVYAFVFIFAHRRRTQALKRIAVTLGILVCFLLVFGMKEVIREIGTIAKTVSEEIQFNGIRALTMGVSWQLVKKCGLFGVGLGNFHWGWLVYHAPPFDHFPERSYNDFLWIWAETGVPGIFCLAGGIGVFLVWCVTRSLKTRSYFLSYMLLASLASVLAFSVHALADPTFYVPQLFWLLAMTMGLGDSSNFLDALEGGPEEKNERDKTVQAFKIKKYTLRRLTIGFVLLMALSIVLLSVGRLRAHSLLQGIPNEQQLTIAMRLDPFSANYPEALAKYFQKRYDGNPDTANLIRFRNAIDEAIRRDPFRLTLYQERARFFLAAEDEKGIEETFERMRDCLPRFYLGELSASAFYMTASIETADPAQARRFEKRAIDHYRSALKHYPKLIESRDLYPLASPAAVIRFREILRQSRIGIE